MILSMRMVNIAYTIRHAYESYGNMPYDSYAMRIFHTHIVCHTHPIFTSVASASGQLLLLSGCLGLAWPVVLSDIAACCLRRDQRHHAARCGCTLWRIGLSGAPAHAYPALCPLQLGRCGRAQRRAPRAPPRSRGP